MKDENDSRELVVDAIKLAEEALKDGGRLSPFVIFELAGIRDVERFGTYGLEEARTRASEFARTSTGAHRCALVHQGRVGLDQDAVLVEVQRGGESDVEVFSQRFRPKGGRLRGFKLIDGVTSAGRRELTY